MGLGHNLGVLGDGCVVACYHRIMVSHNLCEEGHRVSYVGTEDCGVGGMGVFTQAMMSCIRHWVNEVWGSDLAGLGTRRL